MKPTYYLILCGLVSASLSLPVVAAGEHEHGDHGHEADETHLSAERAREAGVKTERAAQRHLQSRERLYGRIRPNAERTARVAASYPGEVVSVSVSVGDRVEKGAELARVRSRDSLQTYVVSAPLSGEIIERHVNPGELAGDAALFLVQDLSSVWLELTAYPAQSRFVSLGQRLYLPSPSGATPEKASVDYIAPHRDQRNQGTRLRATLDNGDRQWLPGQLVVAELVTDTREHSLAVRRTALQTFDGKTVVFVREGDSFRPQPIEVGATDGDFVEVLSGLEAGAEYVSENSFLIKADILKSGASHDH